jgi:8-oxo-dGTP pyrophosphatase MutT (NUDIX family)
VHWQRIDRRDIYSDPWIRVRVDRVIRPDNTPGTYSVVELKGGIGVVAFDAEDRLCLVGQFRYAVNRYSWEIPKGAFPTFDSTEDPLDTAKRELEEETGLTGGDWTKLTVVHTLLGSTNDVVHLFAARSLASGKPHPDATEVLNVRWVTEDRFWEMVGDGEVTDATSIAAVALSRRPGPAGA